MENNVPFVHLTFYEIKCTNLALLKSGFDFVLVARGRTATVPFAKLAADFKAAAKTVGVLADE